MLERLLRYFPLALMRLCLPRPRRYHRAARLARTATSQRGSRRAGFCAKGHEALVPRSVLQHVMMAFARPLQAARHPQAAHAVRQRCRHHACVDTTPRCCSAPRTYGAFRLLPPLSCAAPAPAGRPRHAMAPRRRAVSYLLTFSLIFQLSAIRVSPGGCRHDFRYVVFATSAFMLLFPGCAFRLLTQRRTLL